MAAAWKWDQSRHTYLRNGTPLTHAQTVAVRDALASGFGQMGGDIVSSYYSGGIELGALRDAFAQHVTDTIRAQYLLGRGGVNTAVDTDSQRIISIISEQLGFAGKFVDSIKTGDMSEAEAVGRANLYAGATVQAYEEGRARTYGSLDLPAYPADGSTECLARCRCAWEIEETDTEWNCTWQTMQDDVVCPTCVERGDEWTPWVQVKDLFARAGQ